MANNTETIHRLVKSVETMSIIISDLGLRVMELERYLGLYENESDDGPPAKLQ